MLEVFVYYKLWCWERIHIYFKYLVKLARIEMWNFVLAAKIYVLKYEHAIINYNNAMPNSNNYCK